MTPAIVLLSGGLDSTLSLLIAQGEATVRFALTFDYGQKSRECEISFSKRICEIYKIEHRVVALPFFSELATHPFFGGASSCPNPTAGELDDHKASTKSAKAVWVPNRNGLFINVAASLAERENINLIYVGFNAEEAATFPDNSKAYITAVNESLAYSTLNKVKVTAPTIDQNKTQIVADMVKREFDLNLLWSCYNDGPKMCGTCESCMRLKRALKENKWDIELKNLFS